MPRYCAAMASARSRQLWHHGTPLADAWRQFADATNREKLDSYPGFINSLSSKFGELAKTGLSADFAGSISNVSTEWIERNQLVQRLKDDLLDLAFNGELTLTGYREMPSTSAAPVEIAPADFEYAEADWENSKIIANGKTYGRVRVTNEAALPAAQLPKRRTGRQGSAQAIRNALDKLASEPGFCELHRAEACQKVREALGVKHNTGNGLSDINLSKYIVRKCDSKSIR